MADRRYASVRHRKQHDHHASFEPIYYLVFSPEQILEVKRQTPAWVAKLHQEGWEVHTFSIAEQIWALLKDDPFWSLCVMEDKSAPLDWSRTNKALADILTSDNGLLKRLEDALAPLEGQQNALLLVTDLEALHLARCRRARCGGSQVARQRRTRGHRRNAGDVPGGHR